NLMGDPAVPIWRHFPVTQTVTRPTTIRRGTNNVSLRVVNSQTSLPVEDAFVCLWKGTETYSRGYTSTNGYVNLPCSTSTTGYLRVTITKDDLRPYVDSIQVVSATASLALSTVIVDDDNIGGTIGNGNGVISPGETADLTIRLTNTGTSSTVTGISGTLLTSSPGIQITQATSTYPNITVGGTGNPVTPFRIVVTSVFHNEPVALFLALTSSAGAETVRVNLTPSAADVEYVSHAFGGPGGNTDPGESGSLMVTFRNSGARSLVSSQAVLRTNDPNIYITDSLANYGNVNALATATNSTDPFSIQISPGTFNGHRAVMELVVWDANGFRDSTLFDSTDFYTTDSTLFSPVVTNFFLTIGTRTSTSPSGPDAYGYYAFDNTETQPMGSGATYEWVEVGPGGPGTSLNFSDTGDNLDASTTLTLPFNFTFYGQTFTQITVCTNGWLAFGSYPITDYRNYRMGTSIGPPYMVAAYWDDLWISGTSNNVYYYYDATEHRYIVEWRARTLHSLVNEFFEIILYDPAYYPSVSGDGKVKVQYQTCTPSSNTGGSNDNAYASVGIQNGDHSIGLDYYYANQYGPGAATLQNGLAIMYTTDASGQLFSSAEVTLPNGGENWYVGEIHNIQWYTTGVQGLVDIELNRSYPGGAWQMLFEDAINDGSQSWSVSSPAVSGTARIRVTSVSDPSVGDTSDTSFSISTPSITLTTPNGGEQYAQGSGMDIIWSTVGIGLVRVEINRSYPSASWEEVTAQAVGSYYWVVTDPPTSTARIRLTGRTVPTVGDTSAANFTIGVPPVVAHVARSDVQPGPALFVAQVTDDVPGFVTRLLYRVEGAPSWDSLTFATTGNPDEFAATIPSVSTGTYEYYVRAMDPQGLFARVPVSGTYSFDVGAWGDDCLVYDDGTAENYNWVNGPGFQWAVKFNSGTYPYMLAAGRFAICPTTPGSIHAPIVFRVLDADGPGGMPGSVLFVDTTGSAGNVIGGLPSGAAWAEVVTRVGGQPLQLNGPFYLSVQNIEPRMYPVAFAHDTAGTRNNLSFLYDACEETWFNENNGQENNRPGNRMIRACGLTLEAVEEVVISRTDSAGIISARLRWISTGAPYYKVYSSASASGPFDTLEGTIAGVPVGNTVIFTDQGAVSETLKRYYQVIATDTP
ncbi:hypothetical protein KJ815_14110, partial [bacterium]|nr:hypothetical protein [bacterium]